MQTLRKFSTTTKETPKQNQNLPGFCRYCRGQETERRTVASLTRSGCFQPSTNPVPGDKAPRNHRALFLSFPLIGLGKPLLQTENIFERFFPSMEVLVFNPHRQLIAPPRGIRQFRQEGLNNFLFHTLSFLSGPSERHPSFSSWSLCSYSSAGPRFLRKIPCC